MRLRWWNSFNILAVILLAIGIAGAISGGKMVFDPGRTATGHEWIVYVFAGALMLINGFLPPSNPVTDEEEEAEEQRTAKSRRPAGARRGA